MDFSFCGDSMKTALIWLIRDGLEVVARSWGEKWPSNCAMFDKNYIRQIYVEAG